MQNTKHSLRLLLYERSSSPFDTNKGLCIIKQEGRASFKHDSQVVNLIHVKGTRFKHMYSRLYFKTYQVAWISMRWKGSTQPSNYLTPCWHVLKCEQCHKNYCKLKSISHHGPVMSLCYTKHIAAFNIGIKDFLVQWTWWLSKRIFDRLDQCKCCFDKNGKQATWTHWGQNLWKHKSYLEWWSPTSSLTECWLQEQLLASVSSSPSHQAIASLYHFRPYL